MATLNIKNALICYLVFSVLCSPSVCANEPPKRKFSDIDRLVHKKARRLKPERFGGTLRSQNLNDREVREIVAATQSVYPGAVVTIDAVKNECPCEDGHSCAAQVWVVSYQEHEKMDGLMLSRIENEWQIGPVQAWWLKYQALNKKYYALSGSTPNREERRKIIRELISKRNNWYMEFPVCKDTNAIPR